GHRLVGEVVAVEAPAGDAAVETPGPGRSRVDGQRRDLGRAEIARPSEDRDAGRREVGGGQEGVELHRRAPQRFSGVVVGVVVGATVVGRDAVVGGVVLCTVVGTVTVVGGTVAFT